MTSYEWELVNRDTGETEASGSCSNEADAIRESTHYAQMRKMLDPYRIELYKVTRELLMMRTA
jgi:hypothetical protein